MDPNSRNFWEEEELLPSKFDYRRVQVLDEIEFESVENLLLQDLEETVGNYTMTNKYTRTMMITLKLVLQSGYGSETSDSIYNMVSLIKAFYTLLDNPFNISAHDDTFNARRMDLCNTRIDFDI